MTQLTPLDRARDLLTLGLQPIPIPRGSKGPVIKGWPTLRLDADTLADHFGDTPTNFGTLLGAAANGLIDIDLDDPIAVEIADDYLPDTAMQWGRPGKPRSHRLYRVTPPPTTAKFTGRGGEMIVELRSTGAQTVCPGSLHESGELVEWASQGEPAAVDGDALLAAVAALHREVYRRKYGEPPPDTTPRRAHHDKPSTKNCDIDEKFDDVVTTTAYGRKALDGEVTAVAQTPRGGRNNQLNTSAFKLGTLAAAGHVDDGEACEALLAAAMHAGLSEFEAQRTIASGFEAGQQQPREVPLPGQAGRVTDRRVERNGHAVDVVTTGDTSHARGVRDIPISAGLNDAATAASEDPGEPNDADVTDEPIEHHEPFPVDALPEPVRSYVDQAARAIGCDASYVGLPVLVGAAAAIGTTHEIAIKSSWVEPSVLWGAVLGRSGTAKSPAFDKALRPVFDRQSELMKQHQHDRERYDREEPDFKAKHQRWKKMFDKAVKDHQDPPAEPQRPAPPACQRVVTEDATIEAMAALLQQNPRGLLNVRDELATWLNFGRYNSGSKGARGAEAGKWLQMFGARPLMVDRKTSDDVYVERAAVSIIGGIQPGVLADAVGADLRENGLLARLLLAYPPHRPKQWTEDDIDPDVATAFQRVFAGLFGLRSKLSLEAHPHRVTLDGHAKQVFKEYTNDLNKEAEHLSERLASAWSKLEGYTARLCLVIHLLRAVDEGWSKDRRLLADADSMAAAIALVEYFKAQARRVYAHLHDHDVAAGLHAVPGQGAIDVAVEVRRLGGQVSVRDWHRQRNFRKRRDAEAELQNLVDRGLADWITVKPDGGGRPSKQLKLREAEPKVQEETRIHVEQAA